MANVKENIDSGNTGAHMHDGFRFRHLFFAILVILAVLALYSHDPRDLNLLSGGFPALKAYENWVGPVGAQVARAIYFTVGMAAWPLMFLILTSAVRPFFAPPVRRKGYITALLFVILGTTVLFAMWPENYVHDSFLTRGTESLGIGLADIPEKALSGGVLGQFFAGPAISNENIQPGLIRLFFGEIGTAVTAGIFLLFGLFLIFMSDWKSLIFNWLNNSYSDDDNHAPADKETLAMKVTVIPPPPVQSRKESVPDPIVIHTPPPPKPVIPLRNEEGVDDVNLSETDDLPSGDSVTTRVPVLFGRAPTSSPTISAMIDEPPAVQPLVQKFSAPPPQSQSVTDIFDANTAKAVANAKPGQNKPAQHTDADNTLAPFTLPPVSLLTRVEEQKQELASVIEEAKQTLEETLRSFNINAWVSNAIVGPRVLRFELTLDVGINVKRIETVAGNLAMNLAAESIRILAPIPGKSTVGIEIPNPKPNAVFMRQIMDTPAWINSKAEIPIVIGKDIGGAPYITDLAKMPHLLIAGATGAGKSVCLNTLIMSLLFRFTPDQLRLIMVDPKVVEMAMYSKLPHLITPVVNDATKVPLALRWGVAEMERRYRVMASPNVRVKNLIGFNTRPRSPEPLFDDAGRPIPDTMPYLVIIVDELADVMMTEARKDVETAVARIAQKGRAAGIHLVLATQRPSANIITGVIKANLPTRIAFRVGSSVDSRVILDQVGADRLLGKGDMLFVAPGGINIERIQGALVDDPDIMKVVQFVSDQRDQRFLDAVIRDDTESEEEEAKKPKKKTGLEDDGYPDGNPVLEKYIYPGDAPAVRQSLEILYQDRKISTSYIQRRLGIGYNKAAEIMDIFEQRGIIGPQKEGGSKRDILIFDELAQSDDNDE